MTLGVLGGWKKKGGGVQRGKGERGGTYYSMYSILLIG